MESDEFKLYKSVPSTAIQSWEQLQQLTADKQVTVVSYNNVHTIKSEILRLMSLVPMEERLQNVRHYAQQDTHCLYRIFGRPNFSKFKHFCYENLKCSMQVFSEWRHITPEDSSVFESSFQTHNPLWPSDKCLLFDFMCVALFYNQLSNTEARQRAQRFIMPAHKLFFCFNKWSIHDWQFFSRKHFAQVRGARKNHDKNASEPTDSPAAASQAPVSVVAKVNMGLPKSVLRPKLPRPAAANDVSEAQSVVRKISLQYPDGNVYIDVADPMVFLSEYVMLDVFSDCEAFQVTMETIHDHFFFQKFPSPVILTWKDCDFFGTPKRDFEVSELLLILQGKMQEEFTTCAWEEGIRKLFFKYSYLVKDYFNWVDEGKPNLVYVDTFVMVDLDDPDRYMLQFAEKKDILDLSKHVRVMDRSGKRFPSVDDDKPPQAEQQEEEKSEYERQREERIKTNKEMMVAIGAETPKAEMEDADSDRSKRAKTSKGKILEGMSTRFLRSDNTTLRSSDPMRLCFFSEEQHHEFLSHLEKRREESTEPTSHAAASSGNAAGKEAGGQSVVSKVDTSAAPSTSGQVTETCLNDEFNWGDFSLSNSPVDNHILEGDGDERVLGLSLPSSLDATVEKTASSADNSSAPLTTSSAQPLSTPSVETTAAQQEEQKVSQDNNVGDGSVSAAAKVSEDNLQKDKCADPDDDIAKKQPDNSSSASMVFEPSGSAESGQDVADSNKSVTSVSAESAPMNVDADSGLETASNAAVVSDPKPTVSTDAKPGIETASNAAVVSEPTVSTDDKSDPNKVDAEVGSTAQQSQEIVGVVRDNVQVESAVVVVHPGEMPTGDFSQLLQSINVALSNAFNSQRTQASAAQARCQQQQDVLRGASRDLTEVCSDLGWVLEQVQTFQSSGSSQLVLSEMEQSIAEKRSAVEELDKNLKSKTDELSCLRSKIKERKQEDKRLDAQKAVLDLADQEKKLAFQNEKRTLEDKLRAEFAQKEQAMQAEFQAKEHAWSARNSELERQLSAKDTQYASLQSTCDTWKQLAEIREKMIHNLKSKSVPSSEVSGATGAASMGPAQAKRSDSSDSGSS